MSSFENYNVQISFTKCSNCGLFWHASIALIVISENISQPFMGFARILLLSRITHTRHTEVNSQYDDVEHIKIDISMI